MGRIQEGRQEQFGPNLLEYNREMKLLTVNGNVYRVFSSNSDDNTSYLFQIL